VRVRRSFKRRIEVDINGASWKKMGKGETSDPRENAARQRKRSDATKKKEKRREKKTSNGAITN